MFGDEVADQTLPPGVAEYLGLVDEVKAMLNRLTVVSEAYTARFSEVVSRFNRFGSGTFERDAALADLSQSAALLLRGAGAEYAELHEDLLDILVRAARAHPLWEEFLTGLQSDEVPGWEGLAGSIRNAIQSTTELISMIDKVRRTAVGLGENSHEFERASNLMIRALTGIQGALSVWTRQMESDLENIETRPT